jgi:nucleotide-binding universal stress UspA family protein
MYYVAAQRDWKIMESEHFRSLVSAKGPFVSVYIDDSQNTADAVAKREAIWRDLRKHLEHQAADVEVIGTLEDAVLRGHPAAGRQSRGIIATHEGVLIDEHLSSPPASKDVQLVVVGCHGRTGQHRRLLGSVSTGLIHHAHCPVAVVHHEVPSALQSSKLPVLVGIDGSRASELAIAIAFDEASWRGVDLVALHIWGETDMSTVFGIDSAAVQAAADKTLAESLAGWQERYPEVAVQRVVEFERPVHHLLDQAQKAQLVVVGSHGRGGFAGMLLGSVSTAVAQEARVPVIVARQH